jgi:hypothetical protein
MVPTTDEFLQLVAKEVGRFWRVYIVLDALDECLGDTVLGIRDEFVAALQTLPRRVHVLYTSRNDQSIRALVQASAEIEIKAQPAELDDYIMSRIRGCQHLRDLITQHDQSIPQFGGPHFQAPAVLDAVRKRPGSFLHSLVEAVIKKSDGM